MGDLVTYHSPSWGPSTGEVLLVEGDQVLVQDQAEHGGREWWPAGECKLAEPRLEATPRQIARWLDEHPDQHREVIDRVRVFRCWSGTHGVIMLDHPLTGLALASACHDLDGDGCWVWRAGSAEDRVEGRCGTKREAMEAMAAAMRLRGWTVP